MMTEAAERETFKLSKRLSVEITIGAGGMVVEWHPAIPDDGLTPGELRRYRAARHEMLKRLAETVGGAVVVVEA